MYPTPVVTIGSVMLPFMLTRTDNGTRIRIVVYTFVVRTLSMPMFIGTSSKFLKNARYDPSGVGLTLIIDLGIGRRTKSEIECRQHPWCSGLGTIKPATFYLAKCTVVAESLYTPRARLRY